MAAKKKPVKPKVATKGGGGGATVMAKKVSSNGNGNGSNSSSSSSNANAVPLLPTVIMAAIAFLGGVLTPPSLHVARSVGVDPARNVSSNNAMPAASSFALPSYLPCSSHLDEYLHNAPVPGLHVICVEPVYLDDNGKASAYPPSSDMSRVLSEANTLRFTFYKGSHASPIRRRIKIAGSKNGGIASISWQEVSVKFVEELGLASTGPKQQPWAAFTATGERIAGEIDDLVRGDVTKVGSNAHIMTTIGASGMIVIAQGGNWRWPGVRAGFRRTVELAPPPPPPRNLGDDKDDDSQPSVEAPREARNVTIQTLSLQPLVLSIEGFLTDSECDYIANKASPSMKYSSVSLKDADVGKAASNWRTSQSAFLSADNDPILREIEHRTQSLTRVPRSHQEYVQVLRYGKGEKYDAHHDYFDPAAYQSDRNTLQLIQFGKKNRFATVFWYLTDVHDGGHTVFPRAGGLPPVHDHTDCTRGLKVQPQKGKVIIFYSLDAAGTLDPLSLHGACPVLGEEDVKWAANKWIWNAPMGYVRE